MRTMAFWGVLLLFNITGNQASGREWVDSTGKHRIQAELVSVRADKVVLERSDGRIISLPISRLSVEDQTFLRQHISPNPQASIDAVDAPAEIVQPSELAKNAFAVLQEKCFRCHGKNNSDEGGFDFALDRERLVSSGYVLPKNPQQSPLLQRITSEDSPMPPAGELPRPSPQDIELLTRWIREGAGSADRVRSQPFVSTQSMYSFVWSDLVSVAKRDRPFIRYFSIVHLANAGVSTAELSTYRTALAKLVNSLSWNRQLASPEPIRSDLGIYRIDLRDLKWTANHWKTILSQYPHGLVFDSREAFNVRSGTECEVPIVRADWFVANASRPPLYHELAQIPTTAAKLEELLRVDVEKDIAQGRAVRVGFARSGISQNNRLVERHESIFGAYWKSYDFAENTGRKNLFENPLGPGDQVGTFAHDGGEIIFRLPNGMLGYMLTDQSGRRIDRGPIEIVSDPRQPDRTVVNGVSCMSCHYGGFIQKSDEIRKHVLANESAFRNANTILSLYQEPSVAEKWIRADTADHLATLAKDAIGITNPTKTGEPIILIASRYQNEVDLTMAAAELGIQPKKFASEVFKFTNNDLQRTVGAFKTPGGVLKRETFDNLFIDLAIRLKMGKRPVAQAKPTSTRQDDTVGPIGPAEKGKAGVSEKAQQAFLAAVAAMDNAKWQQAEDEFNIALASSHDQGFRARVYERAIPLYERGESVDRLIRAHQFLLDLCQNSRQIEQARTNLYNSLMRFVEKPRSWFTSSQTATQIDWRVKLPITVSNAVASVFEKQLQENPDHEPALRVMQTYWHHVYDDQQKRAPIMVKLYELHHARGERIDPMSVLDMSYLLTKFGDPNTGAQILADLAKTGSNAQAAMLRVNEAETWIRANESQNAISALQSAQRYYQRSREGFRSTQLVKIGDLFLSLMEPSLAKDAYAAALNNEKHASDIRRLQQKIDEAIAMIGENANGSAPDSSNPKMDKLLDPLLPDRMEAEKFEKDAFRNSSLRVHYMIQASEKWIKAEQPDRAAAALAKAADALRRSPDTSTESNHAKIAELYQQINRNQDAINHWAEALKLSKHDHTIDRYQSSIKTVISDDASIKLPQDAAAVIDPNYKFRLMARNSEALKSYDSGSAATNLVRAAELWSQAGDFDQVRRVGENAEAAISKMTSSGSYSPQEQLLLKLSKAYQQARIHDAAVRCYAGAIAHATSDDKAIKYHQEMKLICEENGLPLPELEAASSAKLDPLNRYRVKAREYEARAEKETNLSSELRYWMQASESWIKADENKKALAAADRHATILVKKGTASEYDFGRLAKLYESIGSNERAIKAYQQAFEKAGSKYQKKKYEEKINVLK